MHPSPHQTTELSRYLGFLMTSDLLLGTFHIRRVLEMKRSDRYSSQLKCNVLL
jgi:hypothetical protein